MMTYTSTGNVNSGDTVKFVDGVDVTLGDKLESPSQRMGAAVRRLAPAHVISPDFHRRI